MDSSLDNTIPIAKLDASLTSTSATIQGIVTVIWPYSPSKQILSLILAERDFRLRRHKGQVRLTFRGHCARALASQAVNSSDELLISLAGAQWLKDKAQNGTPGRGIDWQLSFSRKAHVVISRLGADPVTVDIDRSTPTPEPDSVSLSGDFSPHTITQPSLLESESANGNAWRSPAFLRHRKTYHLPLHLDARFSDEDDSLDDRKRSKRTKFGRRSSDWRFADRNSDLTLEDLSPQQNSSIDLPSPSRVADIDSFDNDVTKPLELSFKDAPEMVDIAPNVIGAETQIDSILPTTETLPTDLDEFIAASAPELEYSAAMPGDANLEPVISELNDPRADVDLANAREMGDKEWGPENSQQLHSLEVLKQLVPEVTPPDIAATLASQQDHFLDPPQETFRAIQSPRSGATEHTMFADQPSERPMAPTTFNDSFPVASSESISFNGLVEPQSAEPQHFSPSQTLNTATKPGSTVAQPIEIIEIDSDTSDTQSSPEQVSLDYPDDGSDASGEAGIVRDGYNENIPIREEISDAEAESEEYLSTDEISDDQQALSSESGEEIIPERQYQKESRVDLQSEGSSEDDEEEDRSVVSEDPQIVYAKNTSYGNVSPSSESDVSNDESDVEESDDENEMGEEGAEGNKERAHEKGSTGRALQSAGFDEPQDPKPNQSDSIAVTRAADMPKVVSAGSSLPLIDSRHLMTDQLEPRQQPKKSITEDKGEPSQQPTEDHHQIIAKADDISLVITNDDFKETEPVAGAMALQLDGTEEITGVVDTEINSGPRTRTRSSNNARLQALELASVQEQRKCTTSALPHALGDIQAEKSNENSHVSSARADIESPKLLQQEKGEEEMVEAQTTSGEVPHQLAAGRHATANEIARSLANHFDKNSGLNFGGYRTPLAYFVSLATISQYFGNTIDTLAIVVSISRPQRSKKGPKDYFSTITLTDPWIKNTESNTSAQVFRRERSALPQCSSGDAILLRNFKVQSAQKKLMLISCDSSAWAVFGRQAQGQFDPYGPPIDVGPEEHDIARGLIKWWNVLNQEEESSMEDSVRVERRHRRVSSKETAEAPSSSPMRHVLRHGASYTDVSGDIVHQLRDGTRYSDP